MGSLNSITLWSGLAAVGVAVPVIIHLLYRKQRKQTPWAAMELLRKALVDRSGQVKLEDFLILFLRCLALVLIALALLRPTLTSDVNPWLGEQNVGMVVGIDASFSMQHGQHSRFEKAVEQAKQVFANAKEGSPVSLVLMSEKPEFLLRSTRFEKDRVDQALDSQAKPTSYRLNLEQNIEQLVQLVSELKTPIKECYLVTDAQESDWATLSGKGRQAVEQLARDASLFIIPIRGDGDSNLAITSFNYSSGSLRTSEVARFTAIVANLGRQASVGNQIAFYANDTLVARQPVGPIEAGEVRNVSLITTFDQPGDVQFKAQLTDDELDIDNVHYAVANVKAQVRVLCVDNESTRSDSEETDIRTGSYYVTRALRLMSRGDDSPMQVIRIKTPELDDERLSDFDLVILAGVDDVAPEMVERLHAFVSNGGGLILFAGDKVEPTHYNARFGVDDASLLPGALGERLTIGDGEDAWPLRAGRTDHRLAGVVMSVSQELLDDARFGTVMGINPSRDSQTILKVAKNDAPLLVEKRIGDGTVLFFASSADRSWSDFAVHPLFTMVVQQAVTQLTSQPDARQVEVGNEANLWAPGRLAGSSVKVHGPRDVVSERKITLLNQKPVCSWLAETPGVYSMAAEGSLPGASIAVNVNAGESNARIIDSAVLNSNLSPLGASVVTDQSSLSTIIENSRNGRELTTILIVVGIAVFLLQSLLARYFTNRQSKEQNDVGESLQLARVAAARRT